MPLGGDAHITDTSRLCPTAKKSVLLRSSQDINHCKTMFREGAEDTEGYQEPSQRQKQGEGKVTELKTCILERSLFHQTSHSSRGNSDFHHKAGSHPTIASDFILLESYGGVFKALNGPGSTSPI